MTEYRKKITLIGDMVDSHPGGGWIMTSLGPRYKVGPKDSVPLLAKRYLGSIDAEAHILALQPRELQNRGIRPGDMLVMPGTAIANAKALGLLVDGSESADIGDITDWPDAWTNSHTLQEQINLNVQTINQTVVQDAAAAQKIDSTTRQAWGTFYDSWNAFRENEPSAIWAVVVTGAYLNTLANRYAAMQNQWMPGANAWGDKIKSLTGSLVGPVNPPQPKPSPEPSSDSSSSIKWIAAAVVVAGFAYVAGPYLRSYKRK